MGMSEVFNYKKIYRAYLACRKTKRGTENALKFEISLERKLMKLLDELKTKAYVPGRSICFVVENPTMREIFAADFRDRVVHHVLVNELEKIGEEMFIFDSFACRKKKGTHLAIKRLREHMRKITRNYKCRAWYMQLDISGFFMSLDRNILYEMLKKAVLRQNKPYGWKRDVLWLAKTFILHKPIENYVKKGELSLFNLLPKRKSLFYAARGKGLPIGNYSSQFFANVYMNKLDQFIKRKLKCKNYVRYVDDLILLGENRTELLDLKKKIEVFVKNELGLDLSDKKTKIESIERGIDFLGYFMKPTHTLVRRRVVKNLKTKIARIQISPPATYVLRAGLNSPFTKGEEKNFSLCRREMSLRTEGFWRQ